MGTSTHIVLAGQSVGVQEVEERYSEREIADGNYDYAGGNTSSGETVTHFSALGVGAVFQAMTLISTGVAKLPLNRYEVRGNQRSINRRHPVQRAVNRRFHMIREGIDYPVAPLAAYHGWQQLVADATLWGNGFAWILLNTMEMFPLIPSLTCYDSNVGLYSTIVNGEEMWLHPREIFHLKGPTVTANTRGPKYPAYVARGLDLVLAAQEVIGNALALQGFQSKFIKNGMRSGGILQLPAGMSKKGRDTVEEGFRQRQQSADSWFKTVVLREGAQYHQTTMDAAVQEQGTATEEQVRELARFWNLQPSDLGLADANGYGSRAEDTRRMVERTLAPWMSSITAECGEKLTTATERRLDSVEFEHDASALLKLDPLQQAQADQTDVLSGVKSRQDIRDQRKLPRVEGLDEYLYPLNMGIVGEEPEDTAPPQPDERTIKLRRILFEVGRMARKKAADPDKFLTWIDAGLEYNRREFVELLGENPDETLDPIEQRFKEIAGSTSPAHFADAVDAYATEIENGI